MPIFPLLFFIIIPALEIYLFIEIGGQIGARAVFMLILATAIIGVGLMRRQGIAALKQAQTDMARGVPPVKAIGHGLLILLAGGLLLVPGFFTDGVGFLLLIPPVRGFLGEVIIGALIPIEIFQGLSPRQKKGDNPPQSMGDGPVIDADFEVSEEGNERDKK